jgi:hypothetical protein
MKFKTIWFMPGLTLKIRLGRTRESIARGIAVRLPLRIRWHVTMQMLGQATTHSKNVPATPLDEILRDLDRPKNVY